MKCTNCGSDVDKKEKYCPVCGVPLVHMDDSGWEEVTIPENVPQAPYYSRQEVVELLEKEPERKSEITRESYIEEEGPPLKLQDYISTITEEEIMACITVIAFALILFVFFVIKLYSF